MFDIRIGTLIGADGAEDSMPLLRQAGFESFELIFSAKLANGDLPALASRLLPAAGDCPVSVLGLYGNTLQDPLVLSGVRNLIAHAREFGCDTVGLFAGAVAGSGVEAAIPLFREVFSGLVELAERHAVRIAVENCEEGGWSSCFQNIGYCEDAWELMFDAVDSPYLGLEWEPAHQLSMLADAEAQLRRVAKKVFHLHGKDATIARDVIRDHGLTSGRPWKWDRNPGFGDSNWANLFTILLQAGFHGFCDIEGYHDPVHFDDMEWTSQLVSLDYLKKCRGGTVPFEDPRLPRGFQGKRKR